MKRGLLPLELVIVLVILIVGAMVYLGGFTNFFGATAGSLKGITTGISEDLDGDDLGNYLDQCPCTHKGAVGSKTYHGCPDGDDTKTQEKSQKEKAVLSKSTSLLDCQNKAAAFTTAS